MSYNETKTVLRAELPFLKEKTYDEAYRYFRNNGFPEAYDIVGEEDENIEWFTYEEKAGEVIPVYDYDEKRWGLELILGKSNDYGDGHYISFSLNDLKEKIDSLNKTYGELDWKLFSYTWYNGGDEPIEF